MGSSAGHILENITQQSQSRPETSALGGASVAWGELPRLWRTWTDMIGLFATIDPARGKVAPLAYEAVHRELIATCKRLASTVDDASRKRVETLTDLAMPWLTTRTLDLAELEILRYVHRRCLQLDQDLNGPNWKAVKRRFRRLSYWGAASLVLVVFLVLTADWVWNPAIRTVGDIWDTVRITIKRTSELHRWVVAGGVFLVLAFLAVFRATRK